MAAASTTPARTAPTTSSRFSSRGPTVGRTRGSPTSWRPARTSPAACCAGQHRQPAGQRHRRAARLLRRHRRLRRRRQSNFFPAGQQWYTASSGTSHSTPAIAGVAALIRQHFINQALPPPSPAMTKALMMNSARYMTGAGANDTLPSNNQGMGEVNLNIVFRRLRHRASLHDQVGGRHVHRDRAAARHHGNGRRHRPSRSASRWPGPTSPARRSGNAYVNNLDLEVTVGGNTYKGNVFSGAFSATGGTADTRNNVESVFIPAGVTGSFVIKVKATNIAGDGVPGDANPLDQDFALVVYNATEAPLPVHEPAARRWSLAESCSPANSAIDPAETVTVNFDLLEHRHGQHDEPGRDTAGDRRRHVTRAGRRTTASSLRAARPSRGRSRSPRRRRAASRSRRRLQLQDGATNLGTATFTFRTGALGAPVTATYSTGQHRDGDSGQLARRHSDQRHRHRASSPTSTSRVRANHTFDGDLVFELVGSGRHDRPARQNRGGSGDNYGTGANDCSGTPTVFDDARGDGDLGRYSAVRRQLQARRRRCPALNGKTSTGTWKLRVADTAAQDTGTMGCVQLEITRQRFVCCGVAGTPQIATGGAAVDHGREFVPPNNAPDPGETVTANFPLLNIGDGNTTNLVATLQNSGGVTPVTTSQNYGVVVAAGPTVSQAVHVRRAAARAAARSRRRSTCRTARWISATSRTRSRWGRSSPPA